MKRLSILILTAALEGMSPIPLEAAMMGRYQLGQEISREAIVEVVRFLVSLTGEFEGRPR